MAFREQSAKTVERGMPWNSSIDDFNLREAVFLKDCLNSMRPIPSFRLVRIKDRRSAVDYDSYHSLRLGGCEAVPSVAIVIDVKFRAVTPLTVGSHLLLRKDMSGEQCW